MGVGLAMGFPPGVGPGAGESIETWFLQTAENLVPFHYHRSANVVNDATITAPEGGMTYLVKTLARGMNQDGYVRRMWAWVGATGAAAWKIKVFRPNGATYDFVSECEFTPGSAALLAFDLSTPLLVQPGDCLGLYLPENAGITNDNTAASNIYGYAAGDITASNAFADQVTGKSLNIAAYGYQPFLVAVGDSIFEGHNTAAYWHSLYDTGPAGTPGSEIWNQMRDIYMPGLQYQNYSKGSQTYSWVNDPGFKEAYTTFGLKASVWLVGAGVNDVSSGRTWEQVVADLDAIRTRCVAGDLWIAEILPWTTGSDAQAETIRTFNTNIGAWCTSNSATLFAIHDAMGQIRVSTGELDDLNASYDQDGVHLTQAGANEYARRLYVAMRAVYG